MRNPYIDTPRIRLRDRLKGLGGWYWTCGSCPARLWQRDRDRSGFGLQRGPYLTSHRAFMAANTHSFRAGCAQRMHGPVQSRRGN